MRRLDLADVAALACELLRVPPAEALDVLDLQRVVEILSSRAAAADLPHEAAAGLLHGFLEGPPLPRFPRRLALLAAVHCLALAGLDVDLEPAEETRKHLQAITIGAATVEQTIAWLDPRVTAQEEGAMFERFSPGARRVIGLAQDESRRLAHPTVGTEHLLLGLLQHADGAAASALAASGISLDAARQSVTSVPRPAGSAPSGPRPFTSRARKVLELGLREALQRGHTVVGTGHLLLGLLREGDGIGVQALQALGTDLVALRETTRRLVREELPDAEEGRKGVPDPAPGTEKRTPGPSDEAVAVAVAYLAGLAVRPRLSREDEVRLAQELEAGRTAGQQLEQQGEDPVIDDDLRSRQEAGEQARRSLVESNLHLSVAAALRFENSGVPVLELIEAGTRGLEMAVDKFDWRKRHPLAGYSAWWIRGAITMRIRGDGRPVAAPTPAPPPPGAAPSAEEVERVLAQLDDRDRTIVRMRFGLGGGELRTLDEVAAHFGITREEVRRIGAAAVERLLHPPPTS